ncbi:MAG: hypothetical protein ABIR06_01245 [Cyclobacteriaceae bacterium]
MKSLRIPFLACWLLVLLECLAFAAVPKAGFFLPDSVHEMTLKYRTVKNLIVLPVTINDSIHLNLILDTGCRNLILFGKRFKKSLTINPGKEIQFSGLGTGKPLVGVLSLGNKVSINEVLGEQIAVVIVSSKNVFSPFHNIHGVIGYDILLKFEIELNARARTITFRPALRSKIPYGYAKIPMKIVDARPVMNAHIFVNARVNRSYDLMIDTGSCLGLLLKTTNISEFNYYRNENVLGLGFSGPIFGYETVSQKLMLSELEMKDVPTGIISSKFHNNASIGMAVLKKYIVILNYSAAYAYFKRNAV